jgi:aryl-alcohol dehydrogenase-like predicted oxidoreductase
MDQRPLGTTDLRVSVLGFGCASVGSRAGGGASRRAIELALESGVTYFDTADMYGLGASEEILGRALGSRRKDVVVSTKCGYAFSNRLRAVRWIKPLLRPLVTRLKGVKTAAASAMASQRSQCFEPAYIERCAEGSLRRLGTDRIDLFFLHDPSIDVLERGDALATLSRLKQAGKIRHYGVSCEPDVAARFLAHAGHGIGCVQVNANVLEPEALATVLPAARAQGIGFVARQPFAHGRVATTDAAAMSIALRFLRDIEGVSSVLAGMINPEHLRANVAAMQDAPLTERERAAADALGGRGRG